MTRHPDRVRPLEGNDERIIGQEKIESKSLKKGMQNENKRTNLNSLDSCKIVWSLASSDIFLLGWYQTPNRDCQIAKKTRETTFQGHPKMTS